MEVKGMPKVPDGFEDVAEMRVAEDSDMILCKQTNGEHYWVDARSFDVGTRCICLRRKKLAVRLGVIVRQMGRDSDVDSISATTPRGCYDGMRKATLRFICGLLKAWRAKEDVDFH